MASRWSKMMGGSLRLRPLWMRQSIKAAFPQSRSFSIASINSVTDVPDIGHHPGGEIGKAKLFILSLIVQVGHGAEYALHRCRGIRKMQEYGIPAVQLHPLQRFVHLLIRCVRVKPAADARVYLRSNFERAVQIRQDLTQEALAIAFVIDIGGIQFVIARIQKCVDKFANLRGKTDSPKVIVPRISLTLFIFLFTFTGF